MYRFLRPLLFVLDPEKAHSLGKLVIRKGLIGTKAVEDERLHTKVGGLELKNPVGLAAGFDKDCGLLDGLAKLGFGFLTVGSITKEPREGNKKPRLIRLLKEEGLINAMGLPSVGVKACIERLKSRKPKTPVIASIAAFSPEEIPDLHAKIEKHVDGIEINISSPTFKGSLEDAELLGSVLERLDNEKPLFVKIPPYEGEKEREKVLAIVDSCYERAAIVAANTKKVKEGRVSAGSGGLSGRPILNDTLRIVQEISEHTDGKADIIACGGISSGKDAFSAITAGARAVELYTAMIYEGPYVAYRINLEFLKTMKEMGIGSIEEIRKV